MAEEMAPQPPQEEGAFWSRVHEHKVIQWGVGYCGAALALAHGAEIITHAFHWPEVVWRAFVIVLIAGFPIAVTVAWYHGHRGFTRISAGELSIVSVLLLIGAVFFTAALKPPAEHATDAAPAPAVEDTRATDIAGASEPLPTDQAPSLAVLPFANNSSDPEQEHFVDGLSGELISSLSRIRGLLVTGRTSSFAFKGSNEGARAIGRSLAVAYVVEGNVQKAGDQLRVAANLVDTRTDRTLWSGNYERARGDIFAIQDEIVTEIAKALQITLGVGDLGRQPGMTRDVEAYEEYLKASAFYAEFEAPSMVEAIDHYRRAITLDATFAIAWVGLATAYSDGILLAPERREESRREAAIATDRARELAPNAPYVLAWEAYQSTQRGSWREAAEFYEKAVPALAMEYGANVEAWISTGRFLMNVGRTSEAIAYFERARDADPLSGAVSLLLTDAYMNAGAPQRAVAEAERGTQLGRQFVAFIRGSGSLAALATRDRGTIARHLGYYAQTAERGGRAIHSTMLPFLDEPSRAVAEVHALAAADWVQEDGIALEAIANWAGYLGEAQLALDSTRRLRDLSTFNAFLLWRPLRADMRKLPGFKDLVREMGLVDYWREYGWPDYCEPVGDNEFACE